jgi:UDP-glucose 4-epimerase
MGGPSFGGIRKEMRILLTGSSGWLGQTLVPRLSGHGHQVIGLDPIPSDHTQIVGSVTDRELVHLAIREFGVDSIIHAGALHKPNIFPTGKGFSGYRK